MTKAIEVITSVQRRRRWSRAEKERIVAAALEPGAVASEVARAAGIHTSQLFWWRQELCRSAQGGAESAPTFSAVTIAPALPEPAAYPRQQCRRRCRAAWWRSSLRAGRGCGSRAQSIRRWRRQ